MFTHATFPYAQEIRSQRFIALGAEFVEWDRAQKCPRTAVPIAMFINIVMIIIISIPFSFEVVTRRCMLDIRPTVLQLDITHRGTVSVPVIIDCVLFCCCCRKQRLRRKNTQALVVIEKFLHEYIDRCINSNTQIHINSYAYESHRSFIYLFACLGSPQTVIGAVISKPTLAHGYPLLQLNLIIT